MNMRKIYYCNFDTQNTDTYCLLYKRKFPLLTETKRKKNTFSKTDFPTMVRLYLASRTKDSLRKNTT